jgi:hypothetical protein
VTGISKPSSEQLGSGRLVAALRIDLRPVARRQDETLVHNLAECTTLHREAIIGDEEALPDAQRG